MLSQPILQVGLLSWLSAMTSAALITPAQAQAGSESAVEPITDPEPRIKDLETVEELAETLANRMIDWGDKLRRRDYAAAADWVHQDFIGHDLGNAGASKVSELPLSVRKTIWDVSKPAVVRKDGFLSGLREFLAPYGTIDLVLPKTKGAEFGGKDGGEGALTLQLMVLGRDSSGGRLSRTAWCRAKVVRFKGNWLVERLTITSLDDLWRENALFTEVARSAGIAHKGPRFGEGGVSYNWNGAAACDFDLDGLVDLFVPSTQQNFLYRNRGDGTFEDVAKKAGVDQPAGGTGALFLDVDNDGDCDLVVGHAGRSEDEKIVGLPTQLYQNQGGGKFKNVSAAAGFVDPHVTFSLAAADVNNDGWIDLYLCSYNSGGFTAPNSWHCASNGTPNALYLNQGNGKFVDRAAAAGVADTRWSYAAAFADFDEDGDQDLYVSNDYGEKSFYRNKGDGTFEDVAQAFGVTDVGNGMGATWGDHDMDGDLDLYVSNMSSTAGQRIMKRLFKPEAGDNLEKTVFKLATGNTIFTRTKDGFERAPSSFGGVGAAWAWAAQFLDFDLDGDEDVACVNGFISGDSLKDT